MNLQKMSVFIILLSLSIGFAKAADQHSKEGYNPYNSRSSYTGFTPNYPSSGSPYSYPGPTPAYPSYSYGYHSNIGAQAPASEKEREFKKLKTELKTANNLFYEKFHGSPDVWISGYKDASKTKRIEMIKEELKLKEAEDAYTKKFRKDFEFSECGIETSYSIIKSTSKKLKIITEEMEFQDLLRSYCDEFQDIPSISDAAMTTDKTKIKANQIEALKREIEIQRLIRDLKSTYPDITDEYLQHQYSQLSAAENGALTRSVIIAALRAEKQGRERR